MLRYCRVFIILGFVAIFVVGASGQVLSYSTYLPGFAANGSMAAANDTGETCVVFIHTHPFAGAKFSSDGSVVYTISLEALTSSDAVTSDSVATTLAAIDPSGNCYLGGRGQINPTPGAFETIQKQSFSPWVAKFDGFGKLIFATYLSGSGIDNANGIAADSDGNLYVTGTTDSNDFPTLHAYQPARSVGSPNFFISVLIPTGTALIYSTYWGGGGESSPAIAVDAAHNAYITGGTVSTNFPLVSPLQTTPAGGVVVKLAPTGTPIYSTYFGSTLSATFGTAIAADQNRAAYVAGYAGQSSIKQIVNPTAFVNKFSADGSALLYSASFWGTESFPTGIAVDAVGQAYVTGHCQSVPLVSPIQAILNSSFFNAFISVLNSTGTALTFSTALGEDARALSIGLDSIPNIYVSGLAPGYGAVPLLKGTYVVPDPTFFSVQPGFLTKISLSPGIALSLPDSVDFGQAHIQLGNSAGAGLLVANASASGNISISDVTITADDFAQTNTCLTTLGPGMGCSISIAFAPTAVGTRTGTITITDSAPGSPHMINLTGTGLAPVPPVTVGPTLLTFEAQAVGTTSGTQQVTLTNTASSPLSISSIMVSGDFSEANNCGNHLPPPASGGNSCQISVFFVPTALGTRTGLLSIADNVSASPQTVNLSGQGVAPNIGLSVPQAGSSTATVNAGGTASYELLIGGAGLGGTASLSCTGAPRGASCTLPNTATIDPLNAAQLDVAVSTTSRNLGALRNGPSGWLWATAIFGLAVLPWSQLTKRTAKRFLPLALVSALLLPSCGGGSGSGPQLNSNGTPAGSYTLTITATMGPNTQSTNLTLTVQ